MKLFFNTVIAISIIIHSSTPALSQNSDSEATGGRNLSVGIGFPDSSQEVQGNIGLGASIIPEYEGADDYNVAALPIAEIRKPGIFFLKGADINPNDGLASAGVTIFHVSYAENSDNVVQFVMGPLIRFNSGRDEDDSETLNGLGDIDSSVGLGGFMELKASSLLATITLSSQNVGDDNDGLLATFDLKYSIPISDKLTLSPGLSTSWGDDEYMQGFFGITDTQALQSGIRRFDSEASFKDVGTQLHASYALLKNLSLDGQIGYWKLLNDAADSPLVADEGSKEQFRGLIGLSYYF